MVLLRATPRAQSYRCAQIPALFGSLGLASATINQRLAAGRRLAYEAADSGLLSPELAAGIRCVKGVKHLGQRSENWSDLDQARLLVDKSDGDGLDANVTLR